MADLLMQNKRQAALQALITAAGADSEVRLFTNNINLLEDMEVADFDEPTGAWYAPDVVGLVVYNEIYKDAETGELVANVVPIQYNWAAAGGAQAVDIRGYFVCNTAGTVVSHAYKFPNVVHLATALDSVRCEPEIRIPLIPQA